LEVGQLQLVPDPVDDILDLEFQHEAQFTVAAAAGTRLALALRLALAVDVAGFAGTLADAGFLFRAAQPEAVVFEETYGYPDRAVRRAAENIGAGDQVR